MEGKTKFIRLEDLQGLADAHYEYLVQRDQNDPLRVFAQHSETIYRQFKIESKESKKAVIKLAQTERLHQLVDMLTSSNILDFIFIKWPAWWANDRIERKKEKRLC